MKQFQTILKFELKNYFANKIFVGVTIFLIVVIAGVMFFPQITQSFSSGISDDGGQDSEISVAGPDDSESDGSAFDDSVNAEGLPVMLISSSVSEETELDLDWDLDWIKESFSAAFAGYHVQTTDDSLDDVKESITSGEAECAFVLDSLTSYTYYVNDLSMYDHNTMTADEVLENIYRLNALVRGGLSAEEAQEILMAPIEHDTLNLGKDQVKNFLYTYIMIFALYMVILLYGQMVATNVATEKSSRAMELLITSAKPVSMMFGKVIASCIAGLVQLASVFGAALLFYSLNKSQWEDNAMISSLFDMPAELLVYMLVFFMLGFFIYAFLFGAVGSTVSKLEDLNTAVMPVTILFVIAFIIVMMSLADGNVDNLLMQVCSFLPFTSPMAMFTRIAMSTVPVWQITVSIAVLVLSVVGIGYISAKIYRAGVLLYGTKPKLSLIRKAVKKA